MKDRYGREITNIRISVTSACDLACSYCHREGERYDGDTFLTFDEVEKILVTASKMGMRKVKFTGGEPLLHPEMVRIVQKASSLMDDVSLTTNGVLLNDTAYQLRSSGLDRVNISLDTLVRKKYIELTGKDKLDDVKKGITKAIESGLFPVKINMLLLKGLNEDEIEDMIEFSAENGAILQIIELTSSVDKITDDYYLDFHVPLDDVARRLEKKAIKIIERNMHRRKKYILGTGEVELVRTMHNSQFCANCTRLRVTSGAELKPCLLRDDNHISIKDALNNGSDISNEFIRAIEKREPYWRCNDG